MTIDLTGGTLHKQMTIMGPLMLKSGSIELPLKAMVGTTEVLSGTPHHVATPSELHGRIKTVRVNVSTTAPQRPKTGEYTGTVALVFEPKMETIELGLDSIYRPASHQ